MKPLATEERYDLGDTLLAVLTFDSERRLKYVRLSENAPNGGGYTMTPEQAAAFANVLAAILARQVEE